MAAPKYSALDGDVEREVRLRAYLTKHPAGVVISDVVRDLHLSPPLAKRHLRKLLWHKQVTAEVVKGVDGYRVWKLVL